jgi:hypothetical protein
MLEPHTPVLRSQKAKAAAKGKFTEQEVAAMANVD